MPDLKVYAKGEMWFAEHREELERDHPGQYFYMNVRTMCWLVAPTYEAASKSWKGRLPFTGRTVLGIQLNPRPR